MEDGGMSDPDDDDDDLEEEDWIDCGLAPDGQCQLAGTEHCDWDCPYSRSEHFVGSLAWHNKNAGKK